MSEETFTSEHQEPVAPVVQKASKVNKSLLVLNIVLLISVGVLYVLFFGQKSCSQSSGIVNTDANVTTGTAELKIAFINTDSIMVNYKLTHDLENEIATFRTNLENSYRAKVTKLQQDFQEYLKVGATLTLTEQKNREESFKKRELEMGELEGRMMNQIQEKQLSSNIRLLNAVYAFVRDYNQKNQQFNIILKKSFADTPVLYIDDSMDITNQIIEGLNKEYDEVQKK